MMSDSLGKVLTEKKLLPTGWEKLKLSAAVDPRGDKVSPADFPGLPFIGMDHVEAHTTKIIGSVPAPDMKSNAARFYAGDILYGRLRPYLNKVAQPKVDGLASAEFIVFPENKLIINSFLKYRLNARDFVGFANHLNEGDRPRVSFEQIGDFDLLVPPIAEQIRIVAKLEELFSELDKGVENLRTAQQQLKVYRQALLKHAFEGKLTGATESSTWKTLPLGSLLDFLTSGSRGWAQYYADEGDIFIRAQNIKHDRLDLSEIAFVSLPERAEGLRTRVRKGDLLITITGANVTKSALVETDLGAAYVSQHVALCRPTEVVLPKYLYWFVIAETAGRKQLNDMAYGAGKPGLNLENIRSVVVPLPELQHQAKVVELIEDKLSVIDQLETTITTSLQQAEALRQSILKKAFSGQLVPQHPDDEPASVLLVRIRAERAAQQPTPRRGRPRRAAA